MKNLSRLIFVIGLLGLTQVVGAVTYLPPQGKYLWSIGYDASYVYAMPHGDFYKAVNNYKIGSTIYAAKRFKNRFGLEIGYNWTDRKPRRFYTPAGSVIFGSLARVNETHYMKVRLKDTYLDAHVHHTFTKWLEGKLTIGIGWVRTIVHGFNEPKVGLTELPDDGRPSLHNTLFYMQGGTTIIARFGGGFQSLITERIGVRMMFYYQTLSNIKIKNIPETSNRQMFNDGVGVSLGIYGNLTGLQEPKF
jgi:hypothetical protein